MREIELYAELKGKLQKLCNDNNLTFSIQTEYPFLLTIKPVNGVDAQQTMMEGMGINTEYISADASLVFAYRDCELRYKISETWTISDDLFGKLKKAFKDLHAAYMAYFFREYHEYGPGAQSGSSSATKSAEKSAAPVEGDTSVFDEFMDDPAPSGKDINDTEAQDNPECFTE